jgi:hypothetical protein
MLTFEKLDLCNPVEPSTLLNYSGNLVKLVRLLSCGKHVGNTIQGNKKSFLISGSKLHTLMNNRVREVHFWRGCLCWSDTCLISTTSDYVHIDLLLQVLDYIQHILQLDPQVLQDFPQIGHSLLNGLYQLLL